MPRLPRKLMHDLAVPIEAEPAQTLEYGCNRWLGRTLPVGVLDPQQEFALMMPCKEPTEQSGTGPPDMQIAGR